MKEIQMCSISSKKLPLNTQTSLQYYTRALFFLSSLRRGKRSFEVLFVLHTHNACASKREWKEREMKRAARVIHQR